jgi:hypothetical protein
MPKTDKTKVEDVVRLHHKTVQHYHHHIIRPARVKDGIKHKATTIRVDLRVWKTALDLAKGDVTRIKVRSEIEVVVVNQSKRRTA